MSFNKSVSDEKDWHLKCLTSSFADPTRVIPESYTLNI